LIDDVDFPDYVVQVRFNLVADISTIEIFEDIPFHLKFGGADEEEFHSIELCEQVSKRARGATTVELADWLAMYFTPATPSAEDVSAHVTPTVLPALDTLGGKLATIEWNKATIAAAIKETLAAHGLKMPQLAHAVRVLVCGRAQTPSIDAVLELFPRELVLERLLRR